MWVEIVGWTGSALLVWSLLQTRILRLRLINLVGSAVLIVYNAIAEVWPMLGLNAVLAVINVVQLRSLLRTRHDEQSYDVVEVEPDGELMAYLLRLHGSDIRRFNPDLDLATGAGGRMALLVMSQSEIAGAVLLRDGGAGVAQLELDYVTPRFRDFSPGEFVFRRSGVFTGRGFRRVITPPGMVGAYYDRLGFRRDGPSYVLELVPGS